MQPIHVEIVGLAIVLLSQIILVAITIQSLRERVKVLEQKVEKTLDTHTTITEVKTKLDMLYTLYINQHKESI